MSSIMRRRSGLMAVSVMRCSCLDGGCQSPIFRQDAAGLSPPANLSRSKARALEAQAVPGLAVFYRVSGFVHWHIPAMSRQDRGWADRVWREELRASKIVRKWGTEFV